MGDQLLLKKLN